VSWNTRTRDLSELSASQASCSNFKSIDTAWFPPHFVVLQPEFKMYSIQIVLSLAYTQYPIMSKWNYVCQIFNELIKNEKLKCLESVSIKPLKFRSNNLLNKSHKFNGLTPCSIIVFNMISEWLPHLCNPHI
jgi:hypothetical protein